MPIALAAQTFTTLVTFHGPNGSTPNLVNLVQGLDGNLYGTTLYGGNSTACGTNGCGTVFRMTTDGILTSLHSFHGTDGATPTAGLTLMASGNLYGIAGGGAKMDAGTVFEITPTGVLHTLHRFCSETNCTDGEYPYGALVRAENNGLYGTTLYGGTDNGGTFFEITPSGTLTTLHTFPRPNRSYHADPEVFVQGLAGNLYGTTLYGGKVNNGTLFRITPGGEVTTFHSFEYSVDGVNPSGLVAGSDGNLYGITPQGGAFGYGTIFQAKRDGTVTTLYHFPGGADDGNPSALIQASDGNFYGTTTFFSNNGFLNNYGSIFKFTLAGTLTTLHTFNGADGSYANGLVQATDGNLYGITSTGGIDDLGTVYRFSTGLAPFVITVPTSGAIGSGVEILGTNLTGASVVTFNGAAAAFQVVSATEITATVPVGATTGRVQVVTPGGTLSSNVAFRVP